MAVPGTPDVLTGRRPHVVLGQVLSPPLLRTAVTNEVRPAVTPIQTVPGFMAPAAAWVADASRIDDALARRP
ncbi:hypothetical protein AB0O86_31560 [Streptomyces hirsutus]|uniref:hypothetical protein n=1 Tax=Streptomyces hirsutus TaxID=35620 RepID=UPI0034308902